MLRDQIIAAVRTGCAALGALAITSFVSLLLGWGIKVEVDPSWSLALSGFMFATFLGAYNFGVNWLTLNVHSSFGWLLGVNQPPTYDND